MWYYIRAKFEWDRSKALNEYKIKYVKPSPGNKFIVFHKIALKARRYTKLRLKPPPFIILHVGDNRRTACARRFNISVLYIRIYTYK